MKRRELIASAVSVAGLAAASQVLAQPQVPLAVAPPPIDATVARADFTGVTIAGIFQAPSTFEGKPAGLAPVVIVKDRDQERYMTIWIGGLESYSISTALENAPTVRPMSHDLMVALVKALQGQVAAVYIRLSDDGKTYLATIKVTGNGTSAEVDSRPSDAIALALRAKAPILVANELFKETTLNALKAELGRG